MIFPDWSGGDQTPARSLPLYTEWAVDWEAEAFALRNGEPYTVSGAEALRVWVYLALRPESVRFLYSAHSADYGNQLAEFLSERAENGILESLVEREVRETLLVSPYITGVDGFAFSRDGSRLTARFTVHTVYDSFESETEVSVI